jgi:GxxExxY protein
MDPLFIHRDPVVMQRDPVVMQRDPFLAKIIELTHDVYTSLGTGYNEVVYHRALEVAFRMNGIEYQSEVTVPVMYKGFNVGHSRIDLMVKDIIIELKAVAHLNNDSIIQIRNYMKTTGIAQGLIINFSQRNSSIELKYIQGDSTFTFENGIFTAAI